MKNRLLLFGYVNLAKMVTKNEKSQFDNPKIEVDRGTSELGVDIGSLWVDLNPKTSI